MSQSKGDDSNHASSVVDLTKNWGDSAAVFRYLDRCRVATPLSLVSAAWTHVSEARQTIVKVLDFGAGDGRFSRKGEYDSYLGYEIDASLFRHTTLPSNATILSRCAFSDEIDGADLCIGNPPYVRNQDLPVKWRDHVSRLLRRRSGIDVSGLANAWQYFFMQSLVSTHDKGLCVLIVPYEWVSRPSARALRHYITNKRWNVKVYRLVDTTFNDVLTTSSITVVDKAAGNGKWAFFEETAAGQYTRIKTPSGSKMGGTTVHPQKGHSEGRPDRKKGLESRDSAGVNTHRRRTGPERTSNREGCCAVCDQPTPFGHYD